MKKFLIIILILIAIIIFGSFMSRPKTQTRTVAPINQPKTIPSQNTPVACPMDAKVCADGSYVSRTGPQCQFTACPEDLIPKSTKAGLGKTINTNGILITPLKVIEDSRCPVDVSCMWVGIIKVLVRLEVAGNRQEVTMELNDPIMFTNKNVTLVNVIPQAQSTNLHPETALPSAYVFTFSVK